MSILYTILVILMVLDGLVLGLVILMQAGKGGGLAAMGGGAATEGILAGRQAATALTRASWISGGLFMFLALTLSIMSSRAQAPTSILQQDFQQQQAPTSAPQPVIPGAGAAGASGASGASGAAPAPAQPAPTPR
jgi:preprotein translocase subunit SecG